MDESAEALWAGFAQADITPGPELSLFGFGFRESRLGPGNDGVLDPLEVRVLVIGTRERIDWVLVSLDTCVIPTGLATGWRAMLARELEAAVEAIWLCATHTHSGPLLREPGQAPEWGGERGAEACAAEESYCVRVEAELRKCSLRAAALRYPVEASVQQAPLGAGYDRRVRRGEGTVTLCWEPQEFPERAPQGAVDPTCSVLCLRQRNGPREFWIWNHGLHPVVLGKSNNRVSADFPGRCRALLEEGNPWRHVLFLNGASAHTHPWLATQENAAALEPVGRACAGMVELLAGSGRPVEAETGNAGSLHMRQTELVLGGRTLPLVAGRMGQLRLAAVSVELFEELGLQLRKRLGEPLVMATLTNGWDGYLPHREAFAEGAYEVDVARRFGYRPGDGETLVERLVELAGPAGNGSGK